MLAGAILVAPATPSAVRLTTKDTRTPGSRMCVPVTVFEGETVTVARRGHRPGWVPSSGAA